MNMIINGEYVDTIFDHNPTEKELVGICGETWRNRKSYLSSMEGKGSISQELAASIKISESVRLGFLLWGRGEKRKAKSIVDILPIGTQDCFWRTVSHP